MSLSVSGGLAHGLQITYPHCLLFVGQCRTSLPILYVQYTGVILHIHNVITPTTQPRAEASLLVVSVSLSELL